MKDLTFDTMHKPLKRFGLDGEIYDDADFPRLRSQYEGLLLQEMREQGYVPVLDLGSFWSTSYDKAADKYQFELSIYSIYVGRRRSWEVEGISDGRLTMRPTPQTKSKQSSEPAE